MTPYPPDAHPKSVARMSLFDTLPRPIRDEINEHPWNITNATLEWRQFERAGISPQAFAAELRQNRGRKVTAAYIIGGGR